MKRGLFISAVAILLAAFTFALAETKADFSGKWMMDTTKSKGVPAGMDQIMIISHKGDRLTVQTKIYPENTPNIIQDDDYTIDGKENSFTRQTVNGESKVKRTAKWNEDGKGFEVTEEINNPGPQGPVTIKIIRKWSMAADGKSLTIELDQTGPRGNVQTSRLFVKQ